MYSVFLEEQEGSSSHNPSAISQETLVLLEVLPLAVWLWVEPGSPSPQPSAFSFSYTSIPEARLGEVLKAENLLVMCGMRPFGSSFCGLCVLSGPLSQAGQGSISGGLSGRICLH